MEMFSNIPANENYKWLSWTAFSPFYETGCQNYVEGVHGFAQNNSLFTDGEVETY